MLCCTKTHQIYDTGPRLLKLVTGRLILLFKNSQRAKKGLSHSPGLVNFAIGLVNSLFFFLPGEQVKFFAEFKLQKNCGQFCLSKKFWGVVKMTARLVHASYSLSKRQSVKLTFLAPFFSEELNCWVPRISKCQDTRNHVTLLKS